MNTNSQQHTTFSAFAAQVFCLVVSHGIYTHGTLGTLRRVLNAHVLPCLGALPVTAITRADICRCVQNGSPQKTFWAIRALYKHSIAFGLVAADPTIGMTAPRRPRRRVIPVPEPALVLAALALLPARARLYFTLGLLCGLRAVELLGLRWSDFHPDGRTAVIDGPDGRRIAFVPGPARNLLQAWAAETGAHGYVFGRGSALPPASLRSLATAAAKKAWREAGVQDDWMQNGRGVTAAYMFLSGIDVVDISRALGVRDETILRHLLRWHYRRGSTTRPPGILDPVDLLDYFLGWQSKQAVAGHQPDGSGRSLRLSRPSALSAGADASAV